MLKRVQHDGGADYRHDALILHHRRDGHIHVVLSTFKERLTGNASEAMTLAEEDRVGQTFLSR
jgi:hypothetical protein